MPVIRPPRFDIKCKSPAAVWLRGFVFCAGQVLLCKKIEKTLILK